MIEQAKNNKYCYKLWPFSKYNHGCMAEYLEEKEKQGLQLDSIKMLNCIAKYEKVQPRQAHYCTDLIFERAREDTQPFFDLCEDSGWERLAEMDECKVFRQRQGNLPPPETDKKRRMDKAIKLELGGFIRKISFIILTLLWAYKYHSSTADIPLNFYTGNWGDELLTVMFPLFIVGVYIDFFSHLLKYLCLWSLRKKPGQWVPETLSKSVILFSACWKVIYVLVLAAVIMGLLVTDWMNHDGPSVFLWMISGMILVCVAIDCENHHCFDCPKDERRAAISSAMKKSKPILLLLAVIWAGYLLSPSLPLPFHNQNLYFSSIQGDRDFNELRGNVVLTARSQQKADLVWDALNQAMWTTGRRLETRYGDDDPQQMPLEQREKWNQPQLESKGFEDYEEGYYYPLYSRLMLRNGQTIRLMEYPEEAPEQADQEQ